LVLMKRDATQHFATFSTSDLELNGKTELATIALRPATDFATATDSHLYLCGEHGAIFEVAR